MKPTSNASEYKRYIFHLLSWKIKTLLSFNNRLFHQKIFSQTYWGIFWQKLGQQEVKFVTISQKDCINTQSKLITLAEQDSDQYLRIKLGYALEVKLSYHHLTQLLMFVTLVEYYSRTCIYFDAKNRDSYSNKIFSLLPR